MATLTHPAREANRIATTPPLHFTNEAMIDWSNPENLRRMLQHLRLRGRRRFTQGDQGVAEERQHAGHRFGHHQL